jgi:hypothetical protein
MVAQCPLLTPKRPNRCAALCDALGHFQTHALQQSMAIICAFGRAAVNLSVQRGRNLHSQTLIALSTGRGRAPVRKGTRGDLDGSYCIEPSEVKS